MRKVSHVDLICSECKREIYTNLHENHPEEKMLAERLQPESSASTPVTFSIWGMCKFPPRLAGDMVTYGCSLSGLKQCLDCFLRVGIAFSLELLDVLCNP